MGSGTVEREVCPVLRDFHADWLRGERREAVVAHRAGTEDIRVRL